MTHNRETVYYQLISSSDRILFSFENGHTSMVKKYPYLQTPDLLRRALAKGHDQIIRIFASICTLHLTEAVRNGYDSTIRLILNQHPSLPIDSSLVPTASYFDRLSTLKLLLSRGLPVTGFHHAINNNSYYTLRYLLSHPERPNINGPPTIYRGLTHQNWIKAKLCLRFRIAIDNQETINYICLSNNLKLMNFSAKHGADFQKYGGMALISACQDNQLLTAKFLLDHKTDPNEQGTHALNLACNNRNLEMVKLFMEYGARPQPRLIQSVCRSRQTEIFELFLDSSLDIPDGCLCIACTQGNLPWVKRILGRVYPDPQSILNAIKGNHEEIVEYLLNNGVRGDNSCLIEASSRGKVNIVQMLIQHRVRPDSDSLMYAAINGHIEVVKLLLQSHPQIFRTKAIHAVQRYHQAEILDLLLKNN